MSEVDLAPFPVWVYPGVDIDWDRIKRVKMTMPDLPRVRFTQATPSTAERVLTVGGKPYFLCDYAMVTARTTDERLAEAIHWVLSDEHHEKATLVVDTLRAILGPEVREITPEELLSEQKMRDYLERRD